LAVGAVFDVVFALLSAEHPGHATARGAIVTLESEPTFLGSFVFLHLA
jgi:hypothetical protein